MRQKVFIVTQVQSYYVCPLDLLQWVNIEDKMKLFWGSAYFPGLKIPPVTLVNEKVTQQRVHHPFRFFLYLFFLAAPSFYGDPSDDPDFLIPISTDYICICEAAALQMEPHDEKGNSRVQFSNNSEKK